MTPPLFSEEEKKKTTLKMIMKIKKKKLSCFSMAPPFLPDYVGVVLFTNSLGGEKSLLGEGGRFGEKKKKKKVRKEGGVQSLRGQAFLTRRADPRPPHPLRASLQRLFFFFRKQDFGSRVFPPPPPCRGGEFCHSSGTSGRAGGHAVSWL